VETINRQTRAGWSQVSLWEQA